MDSRHSPLTPFAHEIGNDGWCVVPPLDRTTGYRRGDAELEAATDVHA